MKKVNIICAILLALPLIVFGSSYFIDFMELPEASDAPGEQLLQSMRDGGLMAVIAASHVVVGVMLVIPKTRFAGGLMQLPMSIGMVAFHATMLPPGLIVVVVFLVLNIGVIAEPKFAMLFERPRPKGA